MPPSRGILKALAGNELRGKDRLLQVVGQPSENIVPEKRIRQEQARGHRRTVVNISNL